MHNKHAIAPWILASKLPRMESREEERRAEERGGEPKRLAG